MHQLTLDAALNLLWLAICVSALGGLAVWELRTRTGSRRQYRLQRLGAVLLVGVSLFPAVSSSDDLFSFSLLQFPFGQHDGVGNTPPEDPHSRTSFVHLVRLLESLGHYELSAFYSVVLALLWVAAVVFTKTAAPVRTVLCRCGRAPPSL